MYIVIEIQKNNDNTIGILTYSFENLKQAKSKYHTILASAAINNLPIHSCMIVDDRGLQLRSECYEYNEQ